MRPRSRAFELAGIVAAVLVVASVYWLWLASSPWDRPIAPFITVGFAWVVLVVAAQESAPSLGKCVVAFGLLGLATVGLYMTASSGAFGRTRYATIFATLEPTAQQLLAGAALPSHHCGPARSDLDYGNLGVPTEVCISPFNSPVQGAVRQVQFRWGDRALVCEGGAPDSSQSECFAHLDGPWWAQIEEDPDCPWGFTFQRVLSPE